MQNSEQSCAEAIVPFVHKNGHTIWLRLCNESRMIGTTKSGKPKFLLVLKDVTATILMQDTPTPPVQDSWKHRLDFVPAMVYKFIADASTGNKRRLISTNRECETIFGLSPDEMSSSSKWLHMIHPDDVEAYEASMNESQATMQRWDLEFRVVVEGEIKWLHGVAMPCREGSAVVWTGVLQDVTALHMQYDKTKKQDIQAAINDRFKAACAYLSHEIRNQLYPQTLLLEEMKDEGPKWNKCINMILNANKTVDAILGRVSDLAKWEASEFPVKATFLPVNTLFKHIAAYATSNGVKVEGLDVDDSALHVKADEHLLNQAVSNLVSNALKFGDGQPVSVSISFEKTNGEEGVIVVRVTDKGRGMTAEQLTKVTRTFGHIRKADDAQSDTGLGLPLSKAMIEVGHKGTLTLASEGLGEGTTATIKVPTEWTNKIEPPADERDSLWWVKPHPGATADILVVDDVRLARMMMTRTARRLGLTFHQASNGVEALEYLRKNTYSMVFMDRQMPVMNGDIATEKARASGYTLPIVMVSGDTFDATEKMELTRRGMTAFLNKMAQPGVDQAMEKLKQAMMSLQETKRE